MIAKGPPRPGLVPQSGDPQHPVRWVLPAEEEQPEHVSRSATRATVTFSTVDTEDTDFEYLDWESLAEEAFSIDVPNYRVEVEVQLENNSLLLSATILFWDEESKREVEAGHLIRILEDDLSVYHDSFLLEEEHQNKGIAASMLEHMEDAYVEHGVASIGLFANDSVGGYAWARQGFDFARDQDDEAPEKLDLDIDAERIIRGVARDGDHMNALIDEYYGLYHAWDIAAWDPTGAPPGEHLGKLILLGSSWHGEKSLDPKSEGYQVGRAYRKARREHA